MNLPRRGQLYHWRSDPDTDVVEVIDVDALGVVIRDHGNGSVYRFPHNRFPETFRFRVPSISDALARHAPWSGEVARSVSETLVGVLVAEQDAVQLWGVDVVIPAVDA